MFDIGFWELMLIGVMGLVVLGPERLPVAIRTVRGWITGVRKFSDSVKSELSEELRIHELHANLKKAEQGNMSNLSPEVADSVKTLKEAAEMVNEPFKKLDTTALDSMIATSLENSKTYQNVPTSSKDDDAKLTNDLVESSIASQSTEKDDNKKDQ